MNLDTIIHNPPSGQEIKYVFVLLHGWGANYHDLSSLPPLLDLPHCQYIFPNAPYAHPHVPEGKAWYALENNNQGIRESVDTFYRWLLTLEDKTNIPLSKTIVGGFSQGGAMSLDVGLQLPVAGVCSISGYLHFEPSTERNPFPPTLICHGTNDLIVPIQAARDAKTKLENVGINIQYKEYQMAHEIIPLEINVIRDFVLKQVNYK